MFREDLSTLPLLLQIGIELGFVASTSALEIAGASVNISIANMAMLIVMRRKNAL